MSAAFCIALHINWRQLTELLCTPCDKQWTGEHSGAMCPDCRAIDKAGSRKNCMVDMRG